jgi:hypothetical protein
MMTKEQAVDCIRIAYDAVINEYATSSKSAAAIRLEGTRVIETLAPEFLTEHDKEILAIALAPEPPSVCRGVSKDRPPEGKAGA